MLRLQRNQAKQCYEKLTQQDPSSLEYINAKQPFFLPCDEKRKTGTSRKMQQGKTARKDVGWTNKMAKYSRIERCAKNEEDQDAKEQGI